MQTESESRAGAPGSPSRWLRHDDTAAAAARPGSTAQLVAAQQQAAIEVKTLKRKVAIGRFSNETLREEFQLDAQQ
jgi:hypothetical protein